MFTTALGLVFEPYVLSVILGSALFGLFVGAIPGLTATMATALLVPVTFFMPPVPAIAAIVTATAMAIFSGDIPAALLRLPGTPASAAYTDESYAMTRKGQLELNLGVNLVFSVAGGLFGTVILVLAAPALAEVALNFSSFEYFWLALLGLTCAVFISPSSPLKGLMSLFIGLGIATIGIDVTAGHPRFTFGSVEMMGGISFIPAMIGMFAVSEVLRSVTDIGAEMKVAQERIGNIFRGIGAVARRYWLHFFRGSILGTAIGALPGAGADIAAWISFAVSKRFSKEPEKFGTGHIEGIVDATSANNSALSGAWIPALVFGIPGDSITAIVIGVLYMKGMNPGPTVFMQAADQLYAVFIVFFLANLLMLPLGWAAIRMSSYILRVSREVLMPIILLFCIVGAFSADNTLFGVGVMLAFGLIGYVMESNEIPLAPAILGLILGPLLEQTFLTTMLKSSGDLIAFFDRPIGGTLGVLTIAAWGLAIVLRLVRSGRRPSRLETA
jgi:TctA family transporter